MDINKVDPPENHKKKDINTIKTLESFEERIASVENASDKNYTELHNAINEIQDKMKSIALMNENIILRMQIFSQKEAELSNLVKTLVEEKNSKSENEEEILNSLKELKINNVNIFMKLDDIERRTKALEIGKPPENKKEDISSSIHETKNNVYVSLKFNHRNDMSMLDKIFESKKDPWQLKISKDNDEELKIFDIDWFRRNLSILSEKCSEINMYNIEALEIVENIIFKNDIIFNSSPETNLYFKRNSLISIEGNVTFNNINIMDSHYYNKFLIVIEEANKLEFNNGLIENNRGNASLFCTKENASLNLYKIIFKNNIQLHENRSSCIYTENKSNVNINKCEFLNHTSKEYPFSARLMQIDGNLTIISTKFENNKINLAEWASIQGLNGNINLDDMKFENCSLIDFSNCLSINIKNSNFMNNRAIESKGGSLLIYECENINIQQCIFRNNKTDKKGGAIALHVCKGSNYIKNCLFKENHSTTNKSGGGGAIALHETEITLENNTFYKNYTKGFGGAIVAQSSKISYGNCTFESNSAKREGGAIYLVDDPGFIQTKFNKFIFNIAPKDNDIGRHD